MKKSILLLALFLFTMQSQAQFWGNNNIKGNGTLTKENRSTAQYEGIQCTGWMDFILVKGNEGDIVLEGEENLLEYIITEVKDNILIVKTQKNINLKPSRNKTIKIIIPIESIDTVSLTGSGDVISETSINANQFYTALTGSGDIDLNLNAESVEASVTGSGDLTLIGKATHLTASVTGSGDFNGYKFQANTVDAKVNGSGDMEVNATKKLKARVHGSGDIEYRGNPIQEDFKVMGSGSVSN